MIRAGQHNPVMPYLYSAWAWGTLGVLTLLALPANIIALMLSAFLDHDRKFILNINQLWCWLNGYLLPLWKHEVRGLENIDPDTAYIISSNHLSAADIVLLAFLDTPFRWVAKHSLYLVPIFGWQLWAMGHLVIRRGSKASRAAFQRRAKSTLDAGLSLLIFPEGTRTRTGEMRDFKPGGFLIARDTGHPILPVVISGTFNAMPPNHILLRNRITSIFKVLAPVYIPPESTNEDIDRIMNELRDRMIEEKKELDKDSQVMLERWLLTLHRR